MWIPSTFSRLPFRSLTFWSLTWCNTSEKNYETSVRHWLSFFFTCENSSEKWPKSFWGTPAIHTMFGETSRDVSCIHFWIWDVSRRLMHTFFWLQNVFEFFELQWIWLQNFFEFFYNEFGCKNFSNFFYNEFGCKNFSNFFTMNLAVKIFRIFLYSRINFFFFVVKNEKSSHVSQTPYLVSMLFSRPRWSFFQGVPRHLRNTI